MESYLTGDNAAKKAIKKKFQRFYNSRLNEWKKFVDTCFVDMNPRTDTKFYRQSENRSARNSRYYTKIRARLANNEVMPL